MENIQKNIPHKWELDLVGKNEHSVFTKCFDCGSSGCNVPGIMECGNCGSYLTVRYYDSETIDKLFKKN
jgi:hypothetical protein